MGSEAKVLRLPGPDQKISCHVTIRGFGEMLREADDAGAGFSAIAIEFQRTAERFDDLARLSDECPDMTWTPDGEFVDGRLTFAFEIPRHYKRDLIHMGWTEEEVDV